jgi:hypothetical protein
MNKVFLPFPVNPSAAHELNSYEPQIPEVATYTYISASPLSYTLCTMFAPHYERKSNRISNATNEKRPAVLHIMHE